MQRFDLSLVKKCGAKTRANTKCKSPAMVNGRCRMHGGKSTGAKTAEGKEKIRKTHIVHGLYGKEYLLYKKWMNEFCREGKSFLAEVFTK
ncbi:MAG: hypothetical protein HON23_05865 [Rickettsiales bacterium]|nr:hypothetical protein [Rickettsiales bacterium]